jgi:L-fuconolactonase
MIIDAHQHVWDLSRGCYDWIGPELGAINRTFTQEQALPLMRRAGVSGVVLVQAADHRVDTDDMLRTAARHPEVVGVVAFVPLDDPAEVAQELARLTEDPVVVGVRQLIHDLPDPDYLLRDDVNESLRLVSDAGLTFDVVSALPRHLEHVPVLAERHPGLRIVIDHLSRPPIGAGSREPWWSLIAEAASHPGVNAKVSGLYPDADRSAWSLELIRPFYDRALEVFGPRRLMWGSDWPVSVLAGGYEPVSEALGRLFAGLGPDDRAELLGGTAARVYRLDASRLSAAERVTLRRDDSAAGTHSSGPAD